MARLRLTLLGGFEAQLASGTVLPLPSRKTRALLAYLAVRQARRTTRDAVATLLWGDVGEVQARQSLRQALAALRRVLPRTRPAVFTADHQVLALNSSVTDVDVLRFERVARRGEPEALQQAVTLYRGDLLEGFQLREARFEEWLRAERERVRGLAVAALERLSGHRLRDGGVEVGVQAGLRLLALDPSLEAVHRALMRLYLHSGRRAAAVTQYRRCAEVLQRELGVAPDAATEALYRDATSRRASPAAVPSLPAPDVDRTGGLARDVRLVGRRAELGELQRAFEEARRGHGRLVAVSGEAGIGKSRLIQELSAWVARQDGRIAEARCFEGEQVLPFAPWVSVLRHEQLRSALADVAGADARSRGELSRLLPELGRDGAASIPEGEYLRIFEAASRVVLAAGARQPLLLVLEDLHWADDMSVRLLAFLARRFGASRLLVVATMRAEELLDRATMRRLLGEAERQVMSLRLAPLAAPETLDLVRHLASTGMPPDALAHLGKRVWRLSEGNPFVVVETMRALGEGSPPGAMDQLPLAERIRKLIITRLDRLGPGSRKLAAVAAVIGREFEAALLRRAAGVSERALAGEVEELVRHRILRAAGDGLVFTHDYVREVAYGELLAPRRRLLHAAVARALEELYAGDLEPHWAALGRHCREAGAWARAATHLRRAAMVAADRAAYEDAVAFLDQAVAALDRLPKSREVLEQGIDARFELGNALGPLGRFDRISGCLGDAERMAAALDDRRRLGWASAYLSSNLWQTGRPLDACATAARARAVGESLGDARLIVNATFSLGVAHAIMGQLDRAEAHLEEMRSLLQGDLGRERCGLQMFPSVSCHCWLAFVCTGRGEFDRGLAHAQEGLRLAEVLDHSFSLGIACWVLGHLYVDWGRFDDATPVLERALALAHDAGIVILLPVVKGLLGPVRAAAGRGADVQPLLEQDLGIYRPGTIYHASARGLQARMYLLVHRLEDAAAAAEEALASAREGHLQPSEAFALRLLGDVAARREPADRPAAEERYQQALALAEQLGLRPLGARCHLELGRLYRRAGKPRMAEPRLLAARAMFGEMGLRPPLEEAEVELEKLCDVEPAGG